MTDEPTNTQNGGEPTTTTTEAVVRPGSRTKLDAATEITIKLIPFGFLAGIGYLGLGLLGLVPLPTFGISFTLMNVLILAGALTGSILFGVAGYMAIKWHRTPNYVHAELLDSAGMTIDEETMTPKRWRQMEVRDEDGRMPPVRHTGGGDTVYLCREINMAENYVKPAGDLEDAPDDDQIIVDKAALKTWRMALRTAANNWKKTRGTLPAIREQIGADNIREMAVSMEQSEHGGEAVEEWLDATLDSYDAIKSEQDEQPTQPQDVLRALGINDETSAPEGESARDGDE